MDRDEMLNRIETLGAEMAEALAPLKAEEANYIAEVEALERPAKMLAAVREKITIIRAHKMEECRQLREAVKKAAPAFLLEAIASVKAQAQATENRANELHRPAMTGNRAPEIQRAEQVRAADYNAKLLALRERIVQFHQAEHKLEMLVAAPGDLTERVTKILVELATAGVNTAPMTTAPPVVMHEEAEIVSGVHEVRPACPARARRLEVG